MLSETAAAHYLAAMIDGEGSVTVRTATTKYRAVRVTNTDWALIQATVACCETLDIEHRVQARSRAGRPAHWKPGWDVIISSREGLERLLAVVPLRAPSKRDRLHALVASYKTSNRPSRETLLEMYSERGMSLTDIMRTTGARSTATVRRWLVLAGIPTRSVSEAVTLDWKRRRLRAVP